MKIRNTPLFASFVTACLSMVGGDTSFRADATGNAAFLARELEWVSAQTYNVLYNPIIGATLVPFNTQVPPGAETFSYDQYDEIGLAEWVTNYGDQPPRVDTFRKRFTAKCRSFWDSYAYTIQDLRASATAAQRGAPPGSSLDVQRAQVARNVLERFHDDVIAFGDTTRGLKGLANNSDIPEVASESGGWDGTETNDEIIADLIKLCHAPKQATHGLFTADTLVLPLSKEPRLSQPYSAFDVRSVLQVFLQGATFIKSVQFWDKLDDATDETGPLALAYAKSPIVVEYVCPVRFEDFPPEQENLEFQVILHARTGGLSIHYPLAMAQMELDD
jgi:hypothetical protein